MAGKARRGRDIPQGISYKVNAPLLPWNKKGLEYLVGLYSHHSWKYKSTFCRRKTKSRDFFFPPLVWIPSFHGVPMCTVLPELEKTREYREEPGATKDHSKT